MQITHVRQEHPNGCGIACVAMLTGQTYTQARGLFGGEETERGMTHYDWFEALARCGYAAQFLFQREQKIGRTPPREVWPLPPWAPAHIVQTGNHYVVMLSDGTILDPAVSSAPRRITDYPADRIYSMSGIFPVNSRPSLTTKEPTP
jgi:hypothetical protein